MMQHNLTRGLPLFAILAGLFMNQSSYAAIGLDRTRVVFDGVNKSMTVNVTNNNKSLPYLAQAWIEDAAGKKITSPLVVLPPVQRIEPGKASQVKIEALPAISSLPQDRESLFYFNLREIPPKSNTPNTLQIALQTRVKLFYRPKSIQLERRSKIWQERITLEKKGDSVIVKNPTPYYFTVINGADNISTLRQRAKSFEPIMVSPFSDKPLGLSSAAIGSSPVITYINDYGGRPVLHFQCKGPQCVAMPEKDSVTP